MKSFIVLLLLVVACFQANAQGYLEKTQVILSQYGYVDGDAQWHTYYLWGESNKATLQIMIDTVASATDTVWLKINASTTYIPITRDSSTDPRYSWVNIENMPNLFYYALKSSKRIPHRSLFQ